MCQELDANPSLVDGETSTKVTANVWKYESRLVAREIKQKGTDSYFAGTPPFALVRYVTSRAATLSKIGKRRQLMVRDAKRAIFHADALTETYVKPPLLRHRKFLAAEEMYVRHASCSSKMAAPCSESRCRHWPAQIKQLSMCVWALIPRLGHGRAW